MPDRSGHSEGVSPDEALDAVRVTAERVERFAELVERERSADARRLWRLAMRDFRDAVRSARGAGWDSAAIQQASGRSDPARFARVPPPGVQDPSAVDIT